MSPIFNGMLPSKMAAHACAARNLLKNAVFLEAAWPASRRHRLVGVVLPVSRVVRIR